MIPREPGLLVAFVLPAGITPGARSLPGAVRPGRWTATFVAPARRTAVMARQLHADAAWLLKLHIIPHGFVLPWGTWQRLPSVAAPEHAVWSGGGHLDLSAAARARLRRGAITLNT